MLRAEKRSFPDRSDTAVATDRCATSDKISSLFRDRGVIRLAEATLAPDEYAHWHATAVDIQTKIYDIDTYYESSTEISVAFQKSLWTSVVSAVTASHGAVDYVVWQSFSDLREYADVELRIHAYDSIDPREFGRIVMLKCSDVAIARALICCYNRRAGRSTREFWSCFDQCGELIEDLADVAEDGRDWNFNFWLYSYMADRGASSAPEGASATLKRKLSALEEAYAKLPCGERQRLEGVLRDMLRAGLRTLREFPRVYRVIASGAVKRYWELQSEARVLGVLA